jgi:cytidylate kinase
MYRAVAWAATIAGISLEDEEAVASLADAATIDLSDDRVFINGQEITRAIRTPDMDRAAAMVARLPRIRAVLVRRQRSLGSLGNVVMEGRDIGTTVFPQADVKIYLDADPAERARRRAADPAHQNREGSVSSVASALEQRDTLDRTRSTSPLAIAKDAVHLDTTHLSIGETVERVLAIVRQRVGAGTAASLSRDT